MMDFFNEHIAPLGPSIAKGIVSTFVFLAGLNAGISASSYKPQVNLSEPQLFDLVYLPDGYLIPSDAIPSNSLPVGAIPSNTKNKDILYAIPSNSIPSNYIPSNLTTLVLAIPSNFVDSNDLILKTAAVPNFALPASNIPIIIFDALPSSALTVKAQTGGAINIKRMAPLKDEVCKPIGCDENTKHTYYSSLAGAELAGPVEVEIWADSYNLDNNECTKLYWSSLAAQQVWLGNVLVEANGAKQICPESSSSYGVSASGYDGSQAGSIISINVSAQEEPQSQAGVELAGPDRCDLFDAKSMKVTYLDWLPGAPLQFHIKIPGGIPGLEKDIPYDNETWEYTAKIGNYSSSNCDIIQGYKERLYCTISLPKEDVNSVRSMSLSVNGCENLIYNNQSAYLPGYAEVTGGGGSGGGGGNGGGSGSSGGGGSSGDPGVEYGGPAVCSSGLDPTSCSLYGGTYITPFCFTSPCIPSFCACP